MLSSACPTPEPAPVPATTPSAVMPTAAQPCSASAATKVNASETSERRMLPPPPDCVMRSPPEPAFPGLAAIRARWDEVERDTQAFIATLDDARLAAPLTYTNMQGETWTYPLWQQMIHQVNHATQHRSEAAVLLTQLGHSPGWLDLLYFVDLRTASTL